MSSNEAQQIAELREHLKTEKIMIVDPGATSRATMHKIFIEFGAAPGNISLVDSYQNAISEVGFLKSRIVVAEYELGKNSGLELLQRLRTQFPKETKNIIFMIVTANTSQTAVAQAAEEDVDAYVLKPFTADIVRKTIIQAIHKKLKPSEYILSIEEGKRLLEEKKIDEAELIFEKALKLDETPTLAYYYVGYVKSLKQAMIEARSNYERGLAFNNVHFKCLAGLFDLLMQEREFKQAYGVVRKLAKIFPANPKRLVDVLKLAIINREFEDIEEYYSIFTTIDERDDMLIRHICTSLIICGKFYLEKGSKAKALELFQKASATGSGRVNFLKEIVQTLLDAKLHEDAETFLKKFTPETMITEAYKVLHFQVMDNSKATPFAIIGKGRELLAENIFSKEIYTILLRRCVETQMNVLVDHLYYQAIKKYPECKADYQTIAGALLPDLLK